MRILTLSSWEQFHEIALELRARRGYVWRGQRKDDSAGWFLQSSFDREVHTSHDSERTAILNSHLHNFKSALRKAYPHVLPSNDAEIWALGQHYGLLTPLLDWTRSPYIAAYFAFAKPRDTNDDSYRYIYALDRTIERLVSKQKRGDQILSTDQSVPFIDQLPVPSPRFTAQKSVFTKGLKGKGIESFIERFSQRRPGYYVMTKFHIPTTERDKCLRALSLMNIDHTSLLLDLSDVVNECNAQVSA